MIRRETTGVGVATCLVILTSTALAGDTTQGTLWGVTDSRPGVPAVVFRIDQQTGVSTFHAVIGDRMSAGVGATILDDVLYASDILSGKAAETVSVDFGSGDPTVISDQGGSVHWEGMAANEALDLLYTLDARDGTNVLKTVSRDGTIVSIGTGTGIAAVGMAYDDRNGILYAITDTDHSLYTIDVQTGASQRVGALNQTIPGLAGLAFDEASGRLYMNMLNNLWSVDVDTGAATQIGGNAVSRINGLAWQRGPGPCTACSCTEDANRDGDVGFADILMILGSWGTCPPIKGSAPGLLRGLASGDPGVLYSVDPATGEATHITDLNGRADFTGLAWLDDVIYGSDLFGYPGESGDVDTGSIDEADGTISFVSDQDQSVRWEGLAANEAAGVLYSVDLESQMLYSLAPDGTATAIAPTMIEARALAYNDEGRSLYATHANDHLYRISTTTGLATLVGWLAVELNCRAGLAYDERFNVLYLNIAGGPDGASLYTLDTRNGRATLVGANGVSGIDGLAWAPDCDACPCPSDIDRNGAVGFSDILATLTAWGPCALNTDRVRRPHPEATGLHGPDPIDRASDRVRSRDPRTAGGVCDPG